MFFFLLKYFIPLRYQKGNEQDRIFLKKIVLPIFFEFVKFYKKVKRINFSTF